MVPRAYSIVSAMTVTVVAAALAAGLTSESILGPRLVQTAPGPSDGPTTPAPPHYSTGTSGDVSSVIPTILTILLLLYALSLLILIVMHRRRGDEDEESPGASGDEETAPSTWQTILDVELGNAAESQLALLPQGTPRNAIIACWMALQSATVDAGLAGLPSETAEEFMLRAVRGLRLDPGAITALAALYREARFSEHMMLEHQRDQAGAALRVLAEQLDRRTGSDYRAPLQPVTP